MSGKEDDSVSAEGVGQDIAVSISESLGKFFNRMRGPEQMTPVSQLNPETVTGDVTDSPVISYLNTAFLPVFKSINDAVQPLLPRLCLDPPATRVGHAVRLHNYVDRPGSERLALKVHQDNP